MSSINYLNIMLLGYFKNPDTLKIHLIRNQKIIEKESFLTLVEFYQNCNLVIKDLEQQFYNIYYKRKDQLYFLLSKQKTEKRDTINIQKDINNLNLYDFGIPLLTITNNQYKGHLYYKDFEFISNTVKELSICVDEELNDLEKREVKESQKDNLHPDIFKDNGYDIFLKWDKICKDEPIKKYSFIFQKLKSKEINRIRNSNQKNFMLWLKVNNFIDNETYQKLFERSYFDSPKKILTYGRNEIFNNINY